VVGEKEAENKEVAVRSRQNGEEGAVALDVFAQRVLTEINNKER
ncbi:MAG TPA: hypothetical protein DIU45_06290, partial [Clostridium sp.]|nr:hypothetical protein [Clostridium sp.]